MSDRISLCVASSLNHRQLHITTSDTCDTMVYRLAFSQPPLICSYRQLADESEELEPTLSLHQGDEIPGPSPVREVVCSPRRELTARSGSDCLLSGGGWRVGSGFDKFLAVSLIVVAPGRNNARHLPLAA